MRPTVMEIDIKKFNENIDNIQRYVGDKKIIPVIKANAYGTYINKNLDVINRFDIVAVALVSEAIQLRELGYKKEIFVLNQPYIDDIDSIIKYDIKIGLSDKKFLKTIIEKNKKISVHLEIETGMNRTGIKLEDLKQFIDVIKINNNIIVEGIYTHLSSADSDKEYTDMQLKIFKEAVKIAKDNFKTIKYIHSLASNGLINFKDDVSNLVRPGMIMYGYESLKGANKIINVKPISKLKTKITFLKEIEESTSVSYCRSFTANKKMKIATIPIGYADGLRRELSNKGYVLVNNKLAKIVGNICMDSCMIDVTNIDNVDIGTDVYIWDNEICTLDNIANACGTINYEILSMISSRVPRIYIN